MNKNNMNKTSSDHNDDMLPEYDFSRGVRGKHKHLIGQTYTITIHKEDGTTEKQIVKPQQGVIVLDYDIQKYFPNSKSVNDALRGLIALIPDKQPNSAD